MNKTFAATLAASALAATAQAFTVTGVSAHQRWPWNNLIDIDFSIGGASADDTFKIDVKATYAGGDQTITAKRFATDPVVKPGANRITWDIGQDYPNFKADDLRVADHARAHHARVGGVQLARRQAGRVQDEDFAEARVRRRDRRTDRRRRH
ncbi:MAG: hypothetical protein IJG13_09810, partial [Kiritimatiellae bacterium]|nr:hypothetical protein [Kiritimatiellia bacterium]